MTARPVSMAWAISNAVEGIFVVEGGILDAAAVVNHHRYEMVAIFL